MIVGVANLALTLRRLQCTGAEMQCGTFYSTLTWPEIGAVAQGGCYALDPFVALIEQHGFFLLILARFIDIPPDYHWFCLLPASSLFSRADARSQAAHIAGVLFLGVDCGQTGSELPLETGTFNNTLRSSL